MLEKLSFFNKVFTRLESGLSRNKNRYKYIFLGKYILVILTSYVLCVYYLY
ncbi:hypothetical protein Hanom_Chr15g01405471 [Helianthus anomalus]